MAYLGRPGATAPLTSADIPDNSITAAKIVADTIAAGDLAPNSVDSSELVDGGVDLSHMSANSVDSDQYVDLSIDTVHIGDNQVTLAKMAGVGSSGHGNLITYDTSGEAAYVATGTSGHVLTSAGAGAVPAFAALPAGGSFTNTGYVVADNSTAGITIDGCFSATYTTYLVIGAGILPANNAEALDFVFRNNSSPTPGNLGDAHWYDSILIKHSDGTAYRHSNSGIGYCRFAPNVANAVDGGVNFNLWMHRPFQTGDGQRVAYHGTISSESSATITCGTVHGGYANDATIAGMTIYVNAGNISKGRLDVYAITDGS